MAEAVPGEETVFLIDKGQRDQVTTRVELLPEITAPVSKGQRLGTMTVQVGQQVLEQIPLVAKEPVARLTFWELFSIVFEKVFSGA